MRKSTPPHGFTIIETLVVLIVVGLLALAGWYVWHGKNSPAAGSSSANSKSSTTSAKAVIPEGYQLYGDPTHSFSIAYPKIWGDMSTPNTNSDYTTARTPDLQSYAFRGDASTATLSGSFSITSAKKAGFALDTGKYGAHVVSQFENGKYVWKITAVNPADGKDSLGSNYTPATSTTTAGVTLYDFSVHDEGTFTTRWLMSNGADYVMITLPQLTSPDYYLGGPNAQTDVSAYADLGKSISNSIDFIQH
ncbi:MAG TPA: prepilin-type N-terminal cleavage/methylation domain-containing protein [Candidatus Saccharimonadales bacterium]|nr:prepilin-type N-terminal cleavage/methylation domain-containing protein [Candidatus Saccharimonadales bacterium]